MRFPIILSLALFAFPVQSATTALSDTTTVVILATTDVHGWVLPWDYYADQPEPSRGLSKVATMVDSIRAVHPHNILVDSGDWLQGNPFAEHAARTDTLNTYAFLDAVDYMRYDAVVLGNHEFNFGLDVLHGRLVRSTTPILGANIYHPGTDIPAYAPYVIRNVGGINVGIVGLTTPGSAVWDRPRVEGRLDFGDGIEAAIKYVREVRDLGADIVVVVAHSGYDGDSSYDEETYGKENFVRLIAEYVHGVDAVVFGHSHRVTALMATGPGGRQVPIVQAGNWASHLGEITLKVIQDDGYQIVGSTAEVHSVAHAESHPVIEAIAAQSHEAVRREMNATITTIDGPWSTAEARFGPTPVVDLIHQAQLAATGAQLSSAAAFSTRAVLGPEAITLGQLAQIYPYENALYVVEISGADLRAYIEYGAQFFLSPEREGEPPRINSQWPGYNFDMIAGVDYALDLTRPVGERLVSLSFEGRPVYDGDLFTMAVNSYRAEGGGGFPGMTEDAIIQRINTSVRSLIVDYLREYETLTAPELLISTWRLSPVPSVDSSAR